MYVVFVVQQQWTTSYNPFTEFLERVEPYPDLSNGEVGKHIKFKASVIILIDRANLLLQHIWDMYLVAMGEFLLQRRCKQENK